MGLAIDIAGIHGPFDAVGICSDRIRRHAEFGLYAEDGIPVPASDIAGGLFTTKPRAQVQCTGNFVAVNEPVLFAGLAPHQFGHVILNSLGRLWALQYLPEGTALLYFPQHQARMARYPSLRPVLELLSISNRLLLHSESTRYHSLYSAEDNFGERHGGAIKRRMRDWLLQRLVPAGPTTKGRKVYFTRSRLGQNVGRYCNEELIEQLLRADGYEVVAPERLSLHDQVSLMQNAEILLFAEGSALHLYGLIQRAGQRAGVIQRRRSLPSLILGQLGEGVADFKFIDSISAIYWPPTRQDHASIATLDFGILREKLVAYRFLSPLARWRTPYTPEIAASLHAGLVPGKYLIPEDGRSEWKRSYRQKQRALHLSKTKV